MKKLTSIILSIILIFSVSAVNTSAGTDKASDLDGIISALNAVEPAKEQMGLSGVDFYELTYSDSVMAYDYTDKGLVFNSEFIPIKYEERVIGWVIKKLSDGEVFYQFTTAFAQEVNRIADDDTEFAIIYGYDASYLYDGKEIYTIGKVSIPVEGRSVLEGSEQIEDKNAILQSISSSYELSYSNPYLNARLPVYFSCNVKYVSQPKDSLLCWAASAACIVNYLNNIDLRADDVAIKWFKTTNYSEYNKGLVSGLQDDVLEMYEVSYTYKNKIPSSDILLRNIQGKYPVFATFRHDSSYHDVVIYGVNIMSGVTYIMDPEYGFCSSSNSSSNICTYVSGYSGVTLTLDSATCMYW